MRGARTSLLLAMAVAAMMLFARLGQLPLRDPDEGRNAEVAREMAEAGSWLTPTYNGLAYLATPPFTFPAVAISPPPLAPSRRPARCAPAAPPARPAASSSCTPATTCCAPPARTGPPAAGCARTTGHTARTSNAPSPRSPPGGDGGSSSATAGRPRITPGSSAAPPRSTCATCSARAWPTATAPGRWPPDRAATPSGPHLSADGLTAGPGPEAETQLRRAPQTGLFQHAPR